MDAVDLAIADFCMRYSAVMDVCLLDFTLAYMCGVDGSLLDLSSPDGRIRNFRPRNGSVIDLRRPDRALRDFRPYNGGVLDLRGSDRSVPDLGPGDRGVLDMCRINGGHLDVSGADRTVLQSARADGVNGQLRAGDDPGRQLAGGDHVTFHSIRNGAQGDLRVPLCQAVVGVLGHPHGHPDADAWNDHADSIAQVNVLQEGVVLVFFRVSRVNVIHIQRDGGLIASRFKLLLGRSPHLSTALIQRLRIVLIRGLLGF